jgi:KaiC/GvpD/RAD55 family RecA-like ATPase
MNSKIKSPQIKNYSLKDSKPIKFIDDLKDKRHIVLFFEDSEYAKIIQFHYIKDGLEKGYACIFTANEAQDEDIIKQEMKDFGINVESYEKKNLLHFFKVPDPKTTVDGISLKLYGDLIKLFEELSKNTFVRTTGTWILNVDSIRDIEKILEIEEAAHNEIKNFNVQALCLYCTQGLKEKSRGDLIQSIIKCHNAAIFASSIGKGIAFDL